jgi:L,D-transpeptidase YcbB
MEIAMRPVYPIVFGLLLSLPLGLAFNAEALAAEPDGPTAVISHPEAIRLAVEKELSAQFTNATETRKTEQAALVEYYSTPDHTPLWVDDNGLDARAKAVIAVLKNADNFGLRSADYAVPDLSGFDPKSLDSDSDAAIAKLADTEIKISFAVMRYANDARGGRIDPVHLDPNLDPTLMLPKPIEVIESIAFRSDPAAYLQSFEPTQPQFEALRRMLIKLRKGEDTEHAPAVMIPAGPVLRKGMQDPQVALLRKRLDIQETSDGPDAKPINPNLFDDAVDTAVRDFQKSHGVSPDGLVGAGTRRALNGKPAPDTNKAAEIRLILVNMERWRWLPDDLGPFYVRVNVPEFKVRVVENRKVLWTSRVVVGMPTKQTPIFQKDMLSIVFNPAWHVPDSIKIEEIKPYIRRDTGWFSDGSWDTSILDRHNLKVNYNGHVNPQNIDWSTVDIRKVAMTQPPGPTNVLGVVKFNFPNKHDVYMHDTTQRYLFAETVRDDSHGCMRVQNPQEMAAILLKHDQNWTMDDVENAIHKDYDQGVPLHQKIPVYITYFTAWANADGTLSTYADIYGHDSRMARALNL